MATQDYTGSADEITPRARTLLDAMGIHYGTAAAERVIHRTPCGLRVRFMTENHEDGTQTLYALHPVTREILVQTSRLGELARDVEGWREGHYLPPGAEFVGCGVVQ